MPFIIAALLFSLTLLSCSYSQYSRNNSYEKSITDIITQRFLVRDLDVDINLTNVIYFRSFDLSSQGAGFLAVHDNFGELTYLGVDIFGTMGSIHHSFTFTEYYIIYNSASIFYAHFIYEYIEPFSLSIRDATTQSQFIIFNGSVYRFIGEEEIIALFDEIANDIFERLLLFLSIYENHMISINATASP